MGVRRGEFLINITNNGSVIITLCEVIYERN